MTSANAQEPRAKFSESASWAAVLGAAFFLVYGTCNWITSTEPDVPTFVWWWEEFIPFLPVMILPYMSIDLFFAGATFVNRSRSEMHTNAARILFALAASGIIFLLFPLKFAYPRPEPTGIFGAILAPLYAHDLPYNLAPSLHISLRVILWAVYGRILGGRLRTAAKLWFFLIGLSTLLVWQHHLIDLIGGFLMGLLTLYVLPDREPAEPAAPYAPGRMGRRLAVGYGGGAALFAILGTLLLPGGAILYWPALALAIVAAGYAGLGPMVFQKSRGAFSAASEWTLLPWILTQRLIRRRWRKGPSFAEIAPGVFFGRRPNGRETDELLRLGVTAVLDLAAESNAPRPFVERLRYRQLSLMDLTPPAASAFEAAVRFIDAEPANGKVYIQCELGLGRSAAVAAAWFMAKGFAPDVGSAAAMVSRARAGCQFPAETLRALEDFHRILVSQASNPVGHLSENLALAVPAD